MLATEVVTSTPFMWTQPDQLDDGDRKSDRITTVQPHVDGDCSGESTPPSTSSLREDKTETRKLQRVPNVPILNIRYIVYHLGTLIGVHRNNRTV